MSFLSDAIPLDPEGFPRRFSLMDIGARGGIGWPWTKVPSKMLTTILAEPDPLEAQRLRERFESDSEGAVLPVALWRAPETLTLNIHRAPATSSLFGSNRVFLDQFPESDRFDVMETIASSVKSVGKLRFGQLPKCMIQREFGDAEGSKSVGFSHSDFGLVIQTLDDAAGELFSGAEVVED